MSVDVPLASPAPLPRAADLAARIGAVLDARARIVLDDRPGRPAAVLLALYDRDERPHIILTKRATHLPAHPGQVSLPGGQRDPDDRDLRTTALRETFEELGIDPAAVAIVGELDDVATFQSQFIVTPVVGVLDATPQPHPNPGEIARVMEIPVAEILAIDAALPPQPSLRELRYPLDGEDVWGATARILRGFAAIARDALAHQGD
jgi:8-oxo-dGTP pyrophosphatase MutT (NUDIX family)